MKVVKSVLKMTEKRVHLPKMSSLMAKRGIKTEATSESATPAKALRCERGVHLCDIFEHPGCVT
jgi:hypothetical protein